MEAAATCGRFAANCALFSYLLTHAASRFTQCSPPLEACVELPWGAGRRWAAPSSEPWRGHARRLAGGSAPVDQRDGAGAPRVRAKLWQHAPNERPGVPWSELRTACRPPAKGHLTIPEAPSRRGGEHRRGDPKLSAERAGHDGEPKRRNDSENDRRAVWHPRTRPSGWARNPSRRGSRKIVVAHPKARLMGQRTRRPKTPRHEVPTARGSPLESNGGERRRAATCARATLETKTATGRETAD